MLCMRLKRCLSFKRTSTKERCLSELGTFWGGFAGSGLHPATRAALRFRQIVRHTSELKPRHAMKGRSADAVHDHCMQSDVHVGNILTGRLYRNKKYVHIKIAHVFREKFVSKLHVNAFV